MAKRMTIGGRYELEPQPLGRGGMGEVWSGYDNRLDRPVAVKFIRVDRLPEGKPDQELTRRFVRESRITARLEHPGVPTVYDAGTHGHDLYLVMQLIVGSSATILIDELGPLPIGWAVAIAAQICSVLTVAHARSLIHRDLKPGNIMLCPDGSVKVLDFGIAATLTQNEGSRLTQSGQVVGTPAYMAPEQALAGAASPSSDLYSLGVVLHEMLAGKKLFAAQTDLALMYKHVDSPPTPLRRLRPDVSLDLEALVLELLEKKPERRPSDAATVYERLFALSSPLSQLTGFVDLSQSHPVRMYSAIAGINSSTVTTTNGNIESPEALSKAKAPHALDPPDLDAPRRDARALIAQSRFGQAAEILSAVVSPAVSALGAADTAVLDLRLDLANALFFGGDYRAAAPMFGELATDLARRHGDDDEMAMQCRKNEATCNAMIGETKLALLQMGKLLDDQAQLFGSDDDRVLDLRKQIGLLQLGAGDRVAAWGTLAELLPVLEGQHGSRDSEVVKIRELLTGLASDVE